MLNFSLIFFMRRSYGTSPALVGWLSAVWAAAYLVGCIGLGRLSRRLSYRGSLPLATFTMGLATLLILIVPSETAAFLWYILFGLITALHWPPADGLALRGAGRGGAQPGGRGVQSLLEYRRRFRTLYRGSPH